jgi:hypothetical protein
MNAKTPALLATLAALALALPAWAGDCECTHKPGDPVSELSHYKAAFAGRVQTVTDKDGGRLVTFQVVRAWKGPKAKALTLTTTSTACGYAFETGKDYVVFAGGEKDALTTDACTPTLEVASAGYLVKQLDLHAGYGGNPLRRPAAK